MNSVAPGISYVDLDFLGSPRVIATAVLDGRSGVALIDPGPSSTLDALVAELSAAGIGIADITAILLTHIHLDHAGATGTLVRQNPRICVHVHERGVPHLVNPEKLLASATRLYGDDMARLWSDVAPVPASAIESTCGGDRLEIAGHVLDVAYTPGHASHHVSYLHTRTGLAFVGDTAGVRSEGPFVLAPTLPPDIDLDLWRTSINRIADWKPAALFLTHFGPWAPVDQHLVALRDSLELTSRWARDSLAQDGDDASREAWFVSQVERAFRLTATKNELDAYRLAGRFDLCWKGLARYWRQSDPVIR
jgi:glyoxylase-like metal-dependent hydrolase (beta-lactamase superfamily II)